MPESRLSSLDPYAPSGDIFFAKQWYLIPVKVVMLLASSVDGSQHSRIVF